ncbi:efflux RND transporter periplasmic adaptor subunit [Shewanella sp. Choline-02u-19]|uniref:efflux RND transporter periplasmic adaptor subunit n=1 Tax=unclassified Shewanella TaxID=196818 RepID=UPI000C3441AB|nr:MULTISPECIES: efflux RND transporter periplasmic adaptor subunit [unclassified Shewanella]PKG72781.1 efflux RND transporter periplasmic adaptor subunit [Shewanella sp. GutCb]PKH57207.1 efflux RND transporter periplasmic adaptor subunit [Shewanella sp. Bg11-22]PKI29678.1 efflux RND transporter periplasmic adaptor subunit [Shewanella sp. Choline-02u-19]
MSLFKSKQFRKNAVCALSSLLVAATPILGYSQALSQEQSETTVQNQQHNAEYYCPMHPEETSHEAGRCSICKMFLVKDESSSGTSIADTVAAVNKDYYCPMHPEVTSHEPGRCPKCNMFLVKEEEEEALPNEHAGHDHASHQSDASKIAVAPQTKAEKLLSQPKPTLIPAAQSNGDGNIKYVCPMHPHVVSDVPGTCPICGMNLEKVTVGGVTEEVVVGVSGGMQQALGMRSEQVTEGTLWKQVKTIGTVQYNENAIGHAHTRVSGWIETLMVHTVGQRVKKGQLLYELYSPELINAQDDYMQAIDYLKQDKNRGAGLLRKARLRLELLGVSSNTIKHLEQTGETTYRVPYYADQDGFVSLLSVRHGMYVEPGNTLFEIVDLSSVWVIADVFENEQSWLEQGRPVEVTSASQGLFDLESTIDYIYPELDPVSRAMRVRIKLENTEKLLKPGTLVDVTLFGGPKKNVLSIPTEALILTGRENRVVVQRDDNKFTSVSVKVGIISQGKAEIIEGLKAGDKVIVSGQFLLDSEASIQGSLQRLSGSNSNVTDDPHASH